MTVATSTLAATIAVLREDLVPDLAHSGVYGRSGLTETTPGSGILLAGDGTESSPDSDIYLFSDTNPYPLLSVDGTITLDDGWAPYAQARLTIAQPSQAAFDALDPRVNPRPRVTITGTRDIPASGVTQTRTFDLVVLDRTLDHNDATVALQLASDEALLQDTGLVATEPDTTALAHQTSVRSIIDNVTLSDLGVSLEPGIADADFTTLSSITNMIVNPSAEVSTAEWAGGGITITRTTAQHYVGNACIQMVPDATGTSGFFASNNTTYTTAKVGQIYTFSVYVRTTVARSVFLALRFLDATNTQVSQIQAAPASTVANTWTRFKVTATAPVGTVKIAPIMYATLNGGEASYWDAAMLVEGNGKETDGVADLAYFDGDTADSTFYNYTWSELPNASPSTRTPVFERDPQTLIREPGETAWAFIAPVLTQAGLRLYCDEQRRWWLLNSAEYAQPGRVTIAAGFNAYRASDTISRTATAHDGTPLWFDSVVVKYTWNDSENVQQIRYDAAGVDVPTKTATIEYNRPYPGPGAASYILSRVNGQGRVLDLTAAFDLVATPGMEAVATLPFTPVQTGSASSVTWDFSADEMTIGTRGLIDTPPSAWLRLLPGEKWTDSPTGASWLAETI